MTQKLPPWGLFGCKNSSNFFSIGRTCATRIPFDLSRQGAHFMRNLGSLGLFLTELSSVNQFQPWKYPVISALDASGAFDVAHIGLEIIRDIYSSQNILVYTEKKDNLENLILPKGTPLPIFSKITKMAAVSSFLGFNRPFFFWNSVG